MANIGLKRNNFSPLTSIIITEKYATIEDAAFLQIDVQQLRLIPVRFLMKKLTRVLQQMTLNAGYVTSMQTM